MPAVSRQQSCWVRGSRVAEATIVSHNRPLERGSRAAEATIVRRHLLFELEFDLSYRIYIYRVCV